MMAKVPGGYRISQRSLAILLLEQDAVVHEHIYHSKSVAYEAIRSEVDRVEAFYGQPMVALTNMARYQQSQQTEYRCRNSEYQYRV